MYSFKPSVANIYLYPMHVVDMKHSLRQCLVNKFTYKYAIYD